MKAKYFPNQIKAAEQFAGQWVYFLLCRAGKITSKEPRSQGSICSTPFIDPKASRRENQAASRPSQKRGGYFLSASNAAASNQYPYRSPHPRRRRRRHLRRPNRRCPNRTTPWP